MKEYLEKIRKPKKTKQSQGVFDSLLMLMLGLILGAILGMIYDGFAYSLPSGLRFVTLFSRIGVWVFIVSCVGSIAPSAPKAFFASLFVFVGALSAFSLYMNFMIGEFNMQAVQDWAIPMAVLAVAAIALWYAKGAGIISEIIACLPISFLLAEGLDFSLDIKPFFFSVEFLPEVIFAVLLLLVFYKKFSQVLRISLFSVVGFFVLNFFM